MDRLGQMMIEARFARQTAILILSPAGERHEDHCASPRGCTDSARDLDPGQAWHAEIEQDHVGPQRFSGRERQQPIGGDVDLMPRKLEQHLQALRSIDIVVRYQDSFTHQVTETQYRPRP